MNVPNEFQQLLLRYRLDELPPDERSAVDNSLIVDQEFSDSLQEAQYDLIDAYVVGQLPVEVRRRVEQAMFCNHDGQSALSMARAMQDRRRLLGESADGGIFRAKQHHTAPPPASRSARIIFLTSSVAACILLLLVILRLHQSPLRHEAQEPPNVSPPKALASANAGASATQAPMAAGRLPIPKTSSASAARPVIRPSDVLAVAMPISTVRGAEVIDIVLHPGTRQVEVQWPIPSDSSATAYSLEIASDKSGITLVPQHGSLDSIDNLRLANFLLPAEKLPDGRYLFRLRASDAQGKSPLVETSVRVTR